MLSPDEARALLRWYADMGVDEAVAPTPTNLFSWRADRPGLAAATAPAAARKRQAVSGAPSSPAPAMVAANAADAPMPADEAVAAAQAAARTADNFEALIAAIEAFEGCPLKAGARKTVVADGSPGGDLLVLGEAPGRDEDATGKPFVGRAGQLLDKMLTSIGRARTTDTLISNVIFWRPPGNRTPTATETAICRPFVDRLIELAAPKVILLAGGAPTQAMLGLSGIMRARGVWRDIEIGGRAIPAMPIFHPAFLLRQPMQKRLAWRDLLALDQRLREG
ncbi:MAG: uracil-DNA glycosylase [Pseudomonadota bacterium]